MEKILIIEDDKAIVDVLQMILESDGYKVEHSFNGPNGLERYKSEPADIVLLDIKMPRMDGIEVLQELKKFDKESLVVMISGHGNIETAVQTTKLGAYDFISKPFDVDRLKLTIHHALNLKRLQSENEKIKKLIERDNQLLGSGEAMKKLRELIQKVASTSTRVLITGENGTGKELAAKEIHRLSDRNDKPFIQVNCATIPSDLIEVELFGCVEGYLSYSPSKRIGKFEQADSGTIFLDEVGDLSIDAQSKLLNVLSENKIEPLGSNQQKNIDVRVIASTNKDLNVLITGGLFRQDLFHRINVLTITVPPLRERREDIPELIEYFTDEICTKNKLSKRTFTRAAIDYLSSMKWQGNVRELKNTVERLIILSDSETIDKKNIEGGNKKFLTDFDDVINSVESLHDFQDRSEKIFIEKKLLENNWNISKTAELMNIQRSHLYNKIKQYGLENPNKDTKDE